MFTQRNQRIFGYWALCCLGLGLLTAGCDSSSSSGGSDQQSAHVVAVIETSGSSGTAPLSVTFDAGASSSDNGALTIFFWEFGDGSIGTGGLVVHTYTSSGSYTVRLMVVDILDMSAEAYTTVVATDAVGTPQAVIAADTYTGVQSVTVQFDATGSVDSDGTITDYAWDFGDGTTDATATPSHSFTTGIHWVSLAVTDDDGKTGQTQTVVAVASWEDEVLRLTNVERWTYDSSELPPLRGQSQLNAAASRHSTDMAETMVDYISHVGTDGSTFDERIVDAGYTPYSIIGENVAAGYASPAAVIVGWMASAGHRANIMRTTFSELGTSYVYTSVGPYYHFWTQDFGTRPTTYPVVIEREAFITTSATVELYIYGEAWAAEMQVSNAADFSGASWEPYAATKTWTLAPGVGVKTVYVKLRNGIDERVSSDSIVLVAVSS